MVVDNLKAEAVMADRLQQEVREILIRLADAVLPLPTWMAGKLPPGPGHLIPPHAALPWRPAGNAQPILDLAHLAAMEFFDALFESDAENEVLAARWLTLKAYPLTYFQPAHGTVTGWRVSRTLNTVARFGAFDGESSNNPYIIASLDGSRNPVSRQVFYAACWDPLLVSVRGTAPGTPIDVDKIDWARFATLLVGDQLPDTWPSTSRVPSREFIKRFTVDLLFACLGQRNAALDGENPLWKRAVLVEASENRHTGNAYTVTQVDDAVAAVAKVLAAQGGR
jgi:hypothetical protein